LTQNAADCNTYKENELWHNTKSAYKCFGAQIRTFKLEAACQAEEHSQKEAHEKAKSVEVNLRSKVRWVGIVSLARVAFAKERLGHLGRLVRLARLISFWKSRVVLSRVFDRRLNTIARCVIA
jgi:hypothetical protein